MGGIRKLTRDGWILRICAQGVVYIISYATIVFGIDNYVLSIESNLLREREGIGETVVVAS